MNVADEFSPASYLPESDEPLWGERRPLPAFLDDRGARHIAFYRTLNIESDATDGEIARAYRSLALLMHPDKVSPLRREAAQRQFSVVSRAFEVLSDPHKRAVYDLLGEEGLKTNWQISFNKHKTPAELRAEIQNIIWSRYSAEAENLVNSRGEVSCIVDGRALLATAINGHTPSLIDRLRHINRRQLTIQHSFSIPVGFSTTAFFKAHALQRPSQVGGNLLANVRHQVSPKIAIEIGSTLLHPIVATSKATYTPEPDSFITLTTISRTLSALPVCHVTFGQTLFPGRAAFCSVKNISAAMLPTFTVGTTAGDTWGAQFETSPRSTMVSGDMKSMIFGSLRLATGIAISSGGSALVTLSGERRLTADTKASLMLNLPVWGSNGIVLRISINRLGQRISIPIILSQRPHVTASLVLLAVPSVSMAALHHLYLLPRKRRKISEKLADLRNEHWRRLGVQKEEAREAITLLRESVSRRVVIEQSRPDGLIILCATYGPILQHAGDTWDVTIAVQALVQNSMLIIPGGRSKSGLLGFYDPSPGHAKRLVLRYSFRRRDHEASFDDMASVTAPLKSHVVQS